MPMRSSARLSRLLASLRAIERSALAGEDCSPLLSPLQQVAETQTKSFTTSAAAATLPANGGGRSGGNPACALGNSSSSSSPLHAVPQCWQHRTQKDASSGTLGPSSRCRWLSSSSADGNVEATAAALYPTGSPRGAHAGSEAAESGLSAASTAAAAPQAAPRGEGAVAGAEAGEGAAAAAGGRAAAPPYRGPGAAGRQARVWPKPPREAADASLPLFPLGAEELATLELLQTRVRMSEAEAEQALTRMCTIRDNRQERSNRLIFSFEQQVKPTVEYLASLPGINLKQCISAYPAILVKGTVTELDRRLQRICSRLGLSKAECSKLLNKNAHTLLTGDLDGRVFPFLDGLEALGFGREEVKAIVLRVPHLLLYSVAKLDGLVRWLKNLGMAAEDVRTVLWKLPTLVSHTPTSCEAAVQWFQQLGVARGDLAIIVRRLPPAITYSPKKRKQFLEFMRDEVGLEDAGIARIMRHTPDTLGRAVERLRHNLTQLVAFGMRRDQIQRLVLANPGLLRMDVGAPTYRNKLLYLQEGLQVEDAVDSLVACPFYLSYRLDRIVLRTEFLKSMGGTITSIAAWLAMSEARFCEEWAGTSVAQFRAWAAEWRHSPEGRHWLGLASERNGLMHTRRFLMDAAADAASHQAAREAMEEEAAAAVERARLHRESQRLFQGQAAQAAAARQLQHGQNQQLLEEAEQDLQRQAAEVERSAQHWEQQAERLLRLARSGASQQEPLAEQAG